MPKTDARWNWIRNTSSCSWDFGSGKLKCLNRTHTNKKINTWPNVLIQNSLSFHLRWNKCFIAKKKYFKSKLCISASLCYKRLSNTSHNFNALMCFEATKKRNKIFSNKFSNHFCNISTFSMQTIFRSPLNIEKADLELE